MAKKPDTVTRVVQIKSMRRLNNTANGNARYEVTFADGVVAKTEPDSSWAYYWADYYAAGRTATVRATFNANGNLSEVSTVAPGTKGFDQ